MSGPGLNLKTLNLSAYININAKLGRLYKNQIRAASVYISVENRGDFAVVTYKVALETTPYYTVTRSELEELGISFTDSSAEEISEALDVRVVKGELDIDDIKVKIYTVEKRGEDTIDLVLAADVSGRIAVPAKASQYYITNEIIRKLLKVAPILISIRKAI